MSGNKAQYAKLEYVAQKPAFLQNFGRPADGASASARRGRDGGDLPSRPKDGRWARGSDDEDAADPGGESGDEWDAMYGGGEGPQVVVLKEGRHLSADEVARERRRAAGLPSPSPPPPPEGKRDAAGGDADAGAGGAAGKKAPRPTPAGHKRKLVGDAVATAAADDGDKKKKKKKKAAKGLLSFDEAEGE